MTIRVRSFRVACAAAIVAVALPVFAQQPAAAVAKPDAPPVKKVDLPSPPPNFEYTPEGRRDPFVSLINRGDDGKSKDGAATAKRADGVPGMLTGDAVVIFQEVHDPLSLEKQREVRKFLRGGDEVK